MNCVPDAPARRTCCGSSTRCKPNLPIVRNWSVRIQRRRSPSGCLRPGLMGTQEVPFHSYRCKPRHRHLCSDLAEPRSATYSPRLEGSASPLPRSFRGRPSNIPRGCLRPGLMGTQEVPFHSYRLTFAPGKERPGIAERAIPRGPSSIRGKTSKGLTQRSRSVTCRAFVTEITDSRSAINLVPSPGDSILHPGLSPTFRSIF